jgi:uncharacterized protein YbaP (TraB family)
VHVTAADAQWRTPAWDQAYAEAGEIWLEADVFSDQAGLAADMAAQGVDLQGRLKERIGRRDFARLVKALKPMGIDAKTAARLQPWFAGVMVLGANLAGSGMQTETGAESSVVARANADHKPLRYFESISDQIGFLASMSEDAQVRFLREMLKSGGGTPEMVGDMTQVWLAGDEDRLTREVVDAMRKDEPEMYDALFRRRNLAWADKLAVEMQGSGVDFITVGAGHLLGRDGVPELMRARGFEVVRVQ